MGPSKQTRRAGRGRAGELWPVLLLLFVVVVPTIGVMWFVSVAMKNEQLASRQQLTDAYGAHLRNVQHQLDRDWADLLVRVESQREELTPAMLFAEVVTTGTADAIVSYDELGELLYPCVPSTDVAPNRHARWPVAINQEYQADNPRAASEIYRMIASEAAHPDESARALQAEVRCLVKAAEYERAVTVAVESLGETTLAEARDIHGRLIVPDVYLMVIEMIRRQLPDTASGSHDWQVRLSDQCDEIAGRLAELLSDYSERSLSSAQRMFLMNRLAILVPEQQSFSTLEGEELAAQFVATHSAPARQSFLQPSRMSDVWQIGTANGDAILLFKTKTIVSKSMETAAQTMLPQDVMMKLIGPESDLTAGDILSISAGRMLPGWRLSLSLGDAGRFNAAVTQQGMLYFWTGVVVILCTSLLAIVIARAFQRELRLASLKSDLVGTVSHELKTPLASIRLLVDTLIDAKQFDEQQTSEYLHLIARENARLSRVIDNFLTFSRIERGKHAFTFSPLSAGCIVERAIEAAGDRFKGPRCSLTTAVEEDLPLVSADEDALVTVILNLLDNAYKYTDGVCEIVISTFAEDNQVCIAIRDNGVGLSRAAAKRVFQRFYQVDDSLARRGNGCGLGLSIVDDIVRAHGGTARVESRPGQGSTFIVGLPAIAR